MSNTVRLADLERGDWFEVTNNSEGPYWEGVFRKGAEVNDYGDRFVVAIRAVKVDKEESTWFNPERQVTPCKPPRDPLQPISLDEELPPIKKFVLVYSQEHRWQVAERRGAADSRKFLTAAEGYLIHDVLVWCDTPPDPVNKKPKEAAQPTADGITYSVGTAGDLSNAIPTVVASLTASDVLDE